MDNQKQIFKTEKINRKQNIWEKMEIQKGKKRGNIMMDLSMRIFFAFSICFFPFILFFLLLPGKKQTSKIKANTKQKKQIEKAT